MAHGTVLAGLVAAVLGTAARSLAFTTTELGFTVEFESCLRLVLLGAELHTVA